MASVVLLRLHAYFQGPGAVRDREGATTHHDFILVYPGALSTNNKLMLIQFEEQTQNYTSLHYLNNNNNNNAGRDKY